MVLDTARKAWFNLQAMSTEPHRKLPGIPDIPADEMTPAVVLLLELCHGQQEQIQALRDELAQLKGQKPKPVIKPSALEGERTGKKKGLQAEVPRQAPQDGKA
jgi:hypothetical protein